MDLLSPLLGVLPVLSCPAPEYDRYELYELVATTERVVAGTIVALQDKTFDLAIERDLFGSGAPTLHLQRFFDWTCAGRWADYAVGQQVVLFLLGDRAMGAGDEGDWPMVDGRVLAPYRIHDRESSTKIFDGREFGTLLTLNELAPALTGFRACFRALHESVDGRDETRLEYLLDAAAAQRFSASLLARHLCERRSRRDCSGVRACRHTPTSGREARSVRALTASAPPKPGVTWVPQWDSEFGRVIASPGDVNGTDG
jgi:hypothetical protein